MKWKWESDLAKASLKRLLEARVTPTPLLPSSFSGSFVLQNHRHHNIAIVITIIIIITIPLSTYSQVDRQG